MAMKIIMVIEYFSRKESVKLTLVTFASSLAIGNLITMFVIGKWQSIFQFHSAIANRQPVNFKGGRFGVDERKEHFTQGTIKW